MKNYVIIVAGGSGTRMGSEIPKQFLLINGKPVLMHTIQAFVNYRKNMQITLVLPKNQIEYWKQLCAEHDFSEAVTIVSGGETRYQSVKNGLTTITEPGLIAVHDGVRPLVSLETIRDCFNAAEKYGAVIPVREVEESLRKVKESKNQMANRANFRVVQTPQVFKSELLLQAYSEKPSGEFLDDATVVEEQGNKIHLVHGNRENIKITTPFDLKVAESILSNQAGHGLSVILG